MTRQLQARPEDTLDRWGSDPELRRVAATVGDVASEEMGWPSTKFLPADPFRVVFWAFEDGLDMECALMEIEDRLGVDADDEEDVRRWLKGDLGSFVAELVARLSRSVG